MYSYICKNCGKKFKDFNKNRKFCSKECMYEGLKIFNVCKNCGKRFWKKSLGNKPIFCSRKCMGEFSKNGKQLICEWCKKEIYKSNVFLKRSNHFFCSQKCANQFQGRNKVKLICKICGKTIKVSKSRIERGLRYCSIKCRTKDPVWKRNACIEGNLIQQNKKGLNKLELKLKNILEEINLEFKVQVLIAQKFLVDFYIPKANLIIQTDGDYWHGNSKKFKIFSKRQSKRIKLDKSQNAYFKKCGYKVLRFWESEVKIDEVNDFVNIKKRILKFTK